MANRIEHRDDFAGTTEVVHDYTVSAELGHNYTVLPSRLDNSYFNQMDQSGLQLNGFDPHSPAPQIIDPDDSGRGVVWDPSKDEHPYFPNRKPNRPTKKAEVPQPVQTTQEVRRPANIQPPELTVFLHVPGARVPFKFHQVIIESNKNLVVLVVDTNEVSHVPEFEVTEKNYIVLSMDEHPNKLHCSYFGQSFMVGQSIHIDVLVLEGEEPK